MEGNPRGTTISALYSGRLPVSPISCQPHRDQSNHLCVGVRACLRSCMHVCVCQHFSNFLSTCARLNCFLCVIDLHIMRTPLLLSASLSCFLCSACLHVCFPERGTMIRGEEQVEAWHLHSEAFATERSEDVNLIVVCTNETPVDIFTAFKDKNKV